jgi:hypothetical protein
MTKQQVIEAIKNSPTFLNRFRSHFGLSPLLQLTQSRLGIFNDLDIVNVHIVKNLKPAENN